MNKLFKERIQEILLEHKMKYLMTTKRYHHQLALDKFNELKALKTLGKERSEKLIQDIRDNQDFTFLLFLDSLSQRSHEYKMIKTIGELVSYTDVSAPNREVFNVYPDKRVLAKCNIPPKLWLINWLHYKEQNYIGIQSVLIKNVIAYYESPQNNINCFSVKDRQKVEMRLFNTNINDEQDNFTQLVFSDFSQLGIIVKNELNRGVLYTAILYHPQISTLWIN